MPLFSVTAIGSRGREIAQVTVEADTPDEGREAAEEIFHDAGVRYKATNLGRVNDPRGGRHLNKLVRY